MEQIQPRQPDLHASYDAHLTASFSTDWKTPSTAHAQPLAWYATASGDAYLLHSSDEAWGEDDWLNHYGEEDEDYEEEEDNEEDDFLYDEEEEDWIDDTEYAYDDEAFTPGEDEKEEEKEDEEDDSYLYYGDDAYNDDDEY